MSELDALMEGDTVSQEISPDHLKRISKLATEQDDLEVEIKQLEQLVKDKKMELQELTGVTLPGVMAEVGIAGLELENGSSLKVVPFYDGHIKEDNLEEAHCWLRDHGFGHLVKNEFKVAFAKGEDDKAATLKEALETLDFAFNQKEAIHKGTLRAFIKEQTEKGTDLPSDLLGIFIGQKTIIKR